MEANVSSYPSAATAQNPLQALHTFATTQNALNQNMQFQQQFAARKALGPILQQSINQETGELDYNRAFIGMSMNPATAWMAPEFLEKATQRQLTQTEIALKNLDMESKKAGFMGKVAMSALAEGRTAAHGPDGQVTGYTLNVTPARMMEIVNDSPLMRVVGAKPLVQFLAQYGSADPARRFAMVQGIATQGMDAQQSADFVLGKFHQIDQGGNIRTTLQTQGTGATEPAGGAAAQLPKTATVGEQMQGLPTVDPSGRTTTLPAYATPGAIPPQAIPPGMPQAGAAGAATRGQPTPGGPLSASGAPPQSASAGDAGTPAAAPGARVTDLGPRAAEIKNIHEKYAPDLNERSRNAQQLSTLMQQAKTELRDFKPGAGVELAEKFARLAQSMGLPQDIVDKIVGATGGGLGSVQAAQKLFLGIGSQMAAQLIHAGGGRLTQTEWSKVLAEGAPNVTMDERGLQRIMNAMQDLVHYTKQESALFQKAKSTPGYDITNWPNDWNVILDKMVDMREARTRAGSHK